MAAAATKTYTGNGIQPAMFPEFAREFAAVLAPGTYDEGDVVGQMSTLTSTADVQTITVSGTPNGGSFRLSFDGVVSGAIGYDDTAAEVQSTLEAMSNIGTGNVTVAGSGFPGNTAVVTFAGTLVNRWQPLLLLYSNSLTGGSSPTATIAHTTPGRHASGLWKPYVDGNSDGSEVAKGVVKYDTVVTPDGKHECGGGEFGSNQRTAPVWVKGYFKTSELGDLDAAACTDLGRIVRGNSSALSSAVTVLEIL